MIVRDKSTAVFGLVTLAIAMALLSATARFEGTADDKLLPQIVLTLMALLGAVLALNEIRHPSTGSRKQIQRSVNRRSVCAVSAGILYSVVAAWLGFYASTFLFLALAPWLFVETYSPRSGARWLGSIFKQIIFAGLFTAFLYVSFALLLKIPHPAGVLL